MLKEANKPFEARDMAEIDQTEGFVGLKKIMEDFYEKGFFTAPIGHFEKGGKLPQLSSEYLWAYSRMMEMSNLGPGSRVLDAGGAGTPIDFYLASKGCQVTCIDQQKDLIDWSKGITQKMGLENMDFIQGDMTQTPFPDNYFDAVFSVAVLQFLPPEVKIRAVKEFARILKKGGILGLVIDFGKSTGRKGKYQSEYYDSLHRPFGNVEEIYKYIINPSGLSLSGNQELRRDFKVDKRPARRALISDVLKLKSLKKILAFPYLFLNSPYFNYTFYSIFLKKT